MQPYWIQSIQETAIKLLEEYKSYHQSYTVSALQWIGIYNTDLTDEKDKLVDALIEQIQHADETNPKAYFLSCIKNFETQNTKISKNDEATLGRAQVYATIIKSIIELTDEIFTEYNLKNYTKDDFEKRISLSIAKSLINYLIEKEIIKHYRAHLTITYATNYFNDDGVLQQKINITKTLLVNVLNSDIEQVSDSTKYRAIYGSLASAQQDINTLTSQTAKSLSEVLSISLYGFKLQCLAGKLLTGALDKTLNELRKQVTETISKLEQPKVQHRYCLEEGLTPPAEEVLEQDSAPNPYVLN